MKTRGNSFDPMTRMQAQPLRKYSFSRKILICLFSGLIGSLIMAHEVLGGNLDAHTVECAVSEFVGEEARVSDFSFNNNQGCLRIGVLEFWNKTNTVDAVSSQKLLAISGIDAKFSPFQKGDEAIHITKLTISKMTIPSDIDAAVSSGDQWGGRTNSLPFKVVIDKLVIEDSTSMLNRVVRQASGLMVGLVSGLLGAKMGVEEDIRRFYESKITRRPYVFTDVTGESIDDVIARCHELISKELEKDLQTIQERACVSFTLPQFPSIKTPVD